MRKYNNKKLYDKLKINLCSERGTPLEEKELLKCHMQIKLFFFKK